MAQEAVNKSVYIVGNICLKIAYLLAIVAYLKKQVKFVLIHPETRDKFHKDRFHYLDSWHRSISHIIWSYFSPRVQNIPLRVHRDIYLCSIQVIISIKTLDPSICYNFLLHIFLLLLFSFYSPLQYSAFTVSIVQRPAGWWASHTRSLSKTLRYSDFIFASDPDINSQVNEEPDVLVWSSEAQTLGFRYKGKDEVSSFQLLDNLRDFEVVYFSSYFIYVNMRKLEKLPPWYYQ